MGVHRRRLAVAVAAGLAVMQFGGGCAATQDGLEAAGTGPLHAVPTGGTSGGAVVKAKGGPLGPADRDLLVKVRQAGLWEIPVGREAAKRAALAATRKQLGGLAEQHVTLDKDVRDVATRLRVPLPDQASEEQQGFVTEIFAKTGKDFDRTAVKRLRIAHGNVLPFIGQVRGSSRNKHIRDFAERAAEFVTGHINMLEDTGLVDANALPPPPEVTGTPDVVPAGQRYVKAPPATSVLGANGLPKSSVSAGPAPGGDAVVKAKGGPLSPADRDLLVKVRQAGLWEIPVGREAAKRAALAATRKQLGGLAEQHVTLDKDVRDVAARLRVPLPDQASEEQQGFVTEIFAKTGKDFDRTAVKRLRIAHGKVLPFIFQVRATTRNKHIRDFAERAAEFVTGHINMLEDTGLVDAGALPPAPEVTGAPDVVPAGQKYTPAPPAITLIDVAETAFGPLNAADRDLLVKVRQAGLWEIPVGREAERRAARPATRKNLGEIARQHVELDAEVTSVAARLGVPLPNEPTEEQKGFVKEIFSKSGKEFDVVAVKRLRIAHGKVFPFIAQVRASTQNTLIREFAQRAATFVNTHMTLLEETGLAGPHALPPPPEVSAAPPASGAAPSAPPATSLPLPGLGGDAARNAADRFSGDGHSVGGADYGTDYLDTTAEHAAHGSGH